jgi:hypothetical protein
LQTFVWAEANGDLPTLRQCFGEEGLKDLAKALDSRSEEEFRAEAKEGTSKLRAYRVVARKVVSNDEVWLGIMVDEDGAEDSSVLKFKRNGPVWKLNRPLGAH